ncbi:CRISPR-associated helicase Cas3' [Streptomyces sp. NBC_00006]|uniref:CRISPR-associated helicase Cas3' n=1 Tax=Streptomyces sp. NBC_00006 TaxID=2975619 RepID=UPI0022531C31|nr:CRISPR-associated helicase Cas3' [Streptomyces sp. NBC_00006]MCX5535175.1 CRISPR-associated helicase Cas3' [Streptomyces sp. NBC_00006]
MKIAPVDDRAWAKWQGLEGTGSPYPAICHLIDTAVLAGHLWDRYLSPGQRATVASGWGVGPEHARALVMFWAGLHDLGKLCPAFQAQTRQVTAGLLVDSDYASSDTDWIRHERVSHLTAPALLADLGYSVHRRPLRSVAHQVGQILGGHHGTYGKALDAFTIAAPERHEPRVGDGPGWRRQRAAHARTVLEICGLPQPPAQLAPAGACVLATGLIILADWIASSQGWVRARHHERRASHDPLDWAAHAARAHAAAPHALSRAELRHPAWAPAGTFQDLFSHITSPYPLQLDIADRLPELAQGPGLVLVTAPTGDGKTEGALFAAHVLGHAAGTQGLGVFLPTMATTDAMFRRVRSFTARTAAHPVPVTLLHSMAWLNADYDPDQSVLSDHTDLATVVGQWLRGRYRGLLAGAAVGTWDTAALAALPTRFNALRWLGLTGKTVIIDEAHAYDRYGHRVTERLLQWLGHLRVPVVLMSATLTGTIATTLVNAYRTGAGHTTPTTINPTYPGWTHVDATTGTVTTSPTLTTTRARQLTITLNHVQHHAAPTNPHSRDAAILRAAQPLTDTGDGALLIVCNTVADAQHTARLLRSPSPTAPLVQLLHARMPARQRAGITRRIERWTGPHGTRPRRPFIVVATQVIEQSLDVDFDHVISDLAPAALLLQRAGRCHRHPRPHRPTWARTPAMTVLVPTGQLPPRTWGSVYPETLLTRTITALEALPDGACRIPDDVQHLVDTVYAEDWATTAGTDHIATELAMSTLADQATIPPPAATRDLHPLTTIDDENLLVTRLGADSIRVLPVWTDSCGTAHLDRQASHRPLPLTVKPDDKTTIRNLIQRTIQIDHRWLQGRTPETNTPTGWADTPALADILLLPQRATPNGARPYRINGKSISVHRLDGLVRE